MWFDCSIRSIHFDFSLSKCGCECSCCQRIDSGDMTSYNVCIRSLLSNSNKQPFEELCGWIKAQHNPSTKCDIFMHRTNITSKLNTKNNKHIDTGEHLCRESRNRFNIWPAYHSLAVRWLLLIHFTFGWKQWHLFDDVCLTPSWHWAREFIVKILSSNLSAVLPLSFNSIQNFIIKYVYLQVCLCACVYGCCCGKPTAILAEFKLFWEMQMQFFE